MENLFNNYTQISFYGSNLYMYVHIHTYKLQVCIWITAGDEILTSHFFSDYQNLSAK